MPLILKVALRIIYRSPFAISDCLNFSDSTVASTLSRVSEKKLVRRNAKFLLAPGLQNMLQVSLCSSSSHQR